MEKNHNNTRQKILIVDDSEMNRSILTDMLLDEYDIIEAENGAKAVALLKQMNAEISLILLDIVMPEMDGFDVLAVMNKNRWIEDIPVIMISAEHSIACVERAYELGVTDFISRPFDALIVHRRVVNTIMLYAKQKKLISMVSDQIYEKEKSSNMMITILSHIVEFRNGESGLHVLHVNTLTDLLLNQLIKKTDKYEISRSDIPLISMASSLHDIGKIAIPENILNKPGKLTDEEFSIMKTHSMIGASMLEGLSYYADEKIVKFAYEICRWHHERYDGRGYPDGLKGDDIPISAQIVSIADVYDALTSERVYKKAFSHEKALKMITNGECGTFNPILLECLLDIGDNIKEELTLDSPSSQNKREIRNIAEEMLRHEELSASERTLRLLEHERIKYQFFASLSHEIQFEFTNDPPLLTMCEYGANQLGIDEIVINPKEDKRMISILGDENISDFIKVLHNCTPDDPIVTKDYTVNINGEQKWYRMICQTTWSLEKEPLFTGMFGKAFDVQNEH